MDEGGVPMILRDAVVVLRYSREIHPEHRLGPSSSFASLRFVQGRKDLDVSILAVVMA